MKKLVITAVAATFLLCGTVVGAAGNSLIGKKVDGIAQVNNNGELTEARAIIVDGSAYVSVRDVGNLANKKVGYSQGVVSLDDISSSSRESIEQKIKSNEQRISELKKIQEEGYEVEKNSEYFKYDQSESYKRTSQEIENLEKENEALKEQLNK
ncbi:hypothetical protein [Paenibacillus aceti]|uniref:Uncharacterized protein n=1 Tax=Paenibacillus aceti TaxID=1820010 RepID=A0ABQ1W5P1_9BACL|nr:hypothetical protein [Paenibacillus aceti]GGG15797.1 hypothetical protein GCM10010913_42240 [Paenibacillus aceti]